MTGKTHLFFGTCIGTLSSVYIMETATVSEPVIYGEIIAACMLGSLIPDIDNKKSTISKYVPFIPNIINKLFGHRGFIHSPLCLIINSILLYLCLYQTSYIDYKFIYYSFIAGCASHLFLDMLTKGGIPLLYPVSKKRYKITQLKTGGFIEIASLFIFAIITLLVILFIIKPAGCPL